MYNLKFIEVFPTLLMCFLFYQVEMSGSQIKVGGSPQSIADGEAYTHMREGTEIFK